MYRSRLPMDVDEMSELKRMSATTYAWLVLAFPLAGSIVIALGVALAAGPHGRLDRLGRDRPRVPERDRRAGRSSRTGRRRSGT